MIAAEYGRLENIKLLAKKVSDIPINIKNRTTSAAIHFAAKNGHSDCVKFLINDLHSDANLSGRFKLTPLMLAC
jgi:ankyrin repeat protein